MGRNPKPTAIKEAAGNPGRRPLNKKEPKPPSGVPVMPRWLSKAARKFWKNTVPLLLEMKVLTKADGEALGSYCEACATLQAAQGEIKRNGIMISIYETDELGKPVKHEGKPVLLDYKTNPAVTIADKAQKLKRALGSDFGLSPVSRPKIHADNGDGESEDPMDAFLRRRTSSQAVTQ